MTSHFRYLRRRAQGAVAAVVSECWTVEAARCTAVVEGVLPDDCTEIYFNLGPHGRRPYDGVVDISHRAAWVVGPRASTLHVAKETRDCLIVGVRLRSGVAQAMLGAPALALERQLIDLDHFWKCDVDAIREQMHAAGDARARFDIAEHAILTRLRRVNDGELTRARALCEATGTLVAGSIGGLAAGHGLTHRKLISFFDENVGLKPKEFQRVHRLRHALPALADKNRPIAHVAADSGYFDEAHFVHDFRKLTGMTPRAYSAKRMSIGHGSIRFIAAG